MNNQIESSENINLSYAFAWDETAEGHYYWEYVSCAILKLNESDKLTFHNWHILHPSLLYGEDTYNPRDVNIEVIDNVIKLINNKDNYEPEGKGWWVDVIMRLDKIKLTAENWLLGVCDKVENVISQDIYTRIKQESIEKQHEEMLEEQYEEMLKEPKIPHNIEEMLEEQNVTHSIVEIGQEEIHGDPSYAAWPSWDGYGKE